LVSQALNVSRPSQRLILPATTTAGVVQQVTCITSTASLRPGDLGDATLHMRQAAKDFQVVDWSLFVVAGTA